MQARSIGKKLFHLAALASLALALSAQAVFASGGSGGGGGGGGGGTTTATCTPINSWKATAGYRPSSNSSIGAVWVTYKLNTCLTSTTSVSTHIDEYNMTTGGQLAWSVTVPWASGTLDNDWVPLSTTYHVVISVVDNSGTVLQTLAMDATTPTKNSTGV